MSRKPIIFETPQIYFPKLFTAVSKTVPHIELTSDAAVIDGYSFRKKRHSVKITNYHGRSHKELIIPYSIDGMPVDEICKDAFRKYPCSTIYIHGKIRKVGESAFRGSTVRLVVFEDGITSLSECSFSGCRMLEKVKFPLTLKNIGYRCFWGCESLKYLEFPKNIHNIEDQAFYSSGLESFGVEAITTGINNADAFSATPLSNNNQVVCTYPDPLNLIVLHVNGGSFKFIADSITFCRWALRSTNLDLSECKNVSFYRNAVRNELPRDKGNMSYGVSPCTIILPDKQESELHYAFPKHVTVVNYFHDKDRIYKKPYEIEYNRTDDTYIITPVVDFFPPWSVKEDCEKIVVNGRVHIDRNAIYCHDLKEITFEDFSPEDRIFSLYCYDLRKVSFNYNGRIVTKYIPNGDLTSWVIHKMLLMTFKPCSVSCGNGFIRAFYNRDIIDSIFNNKFASSDDNKWVRLLNYRLYQAGWVHRLTDKLSFRLTNKIKALIAVDIVRSDRLDHEPPVDMYRDFLKTHRSFCYKYFRKISGKYPEYLHAFEQIMSDN
ncbi:MAG: leucine-rich repeat domain-containing protein [Ruminococcus sp.]|nr:leucine-rich repeat domain-containing protein [Ruminococcus sp.]